MKTNTEKLKFCYPVLSRLLAAAAMLATLVSQAHALGTNSWDLGTNADYYIAPADQPLVMIDETQSVARLILLSDQIGHSTFAEYVTNGSSHVSTRLGPDVSLSLRQSGGIYQSPGTFISRVLDSGSPANTWQKLYANGTFGAINNSLDQILVGADGPVALYHLDGSWLDEVSRVDATPTGAGFTGDAMIGKMSATFSGGVGGTYASTTDASLLTGASAVTYSCWVKFRTFVNYTGIVASRGTTLNGLYLGGSRNIMVIVGASSVEAATQLAPGQWHHLCVTWRSQDGALKIYLNGVLDLATTRETGRLIVQTDVFRLNWEDGDPARKSDCNIDEIALYRRALREDEVIELYRKGAGASFFFQLRSGNTPEATTNSANDFTGPDGATNSYYFGVNRILTTAGSFDVTNRYAQYKAYLLSDTTGNTPWIDAIALLGDLGIDYDYSYLDFQLGNFASNTTNYPGVVDTPYLGMVKKENGGYFTNGIYLSRIIDAGSSVNWRNLQWQMPEETAFDITGLMALYHLNGSWGDAANAGGDNTPTSITLPVNALTAMPKLGADSCRFDGVSSRVTGFPGLSSNIMALEFWINDDNAQDGIMTLGSYPAGPAYLAISNGCIIASGISTAVPKIFVNGITGSRKLLAGWNHVALVMSKPLTGAALDVGVANGDYLDGLLDEIAIYARDISSAEVKAHYLLGRQGVGGRVKFAVRSADSVSGLTGTVWSADIGSTPADPNIWGQYFQYRLVMEGDGSASPAVRDIIVGYLNPGWNYVYENRRELIYQGTFVDGLTRWCGDEVALVDQFQWGPANLMPASEVGLVSEWRLDDAAWGSVKDSVGGSDGSAQGGPLTTPDAKVGLRSGTFSGVGQYLTLGSAIVGSSDFTFGAWAKSTSTNRSAIISTFAGGPHYTLAFNSDGISTSNQPGQTAFIIDDGGGAKVAASVMTDLNDGRWHHLAGVRDGNMMHLFVDGDRVASTSLGASFGSVGSGVPYVARYGTNNLFFGGQLDEVIFYRRALSDEEVGGVSGVAFKPSDRGVYTSEIINVGRQVIWRTLSWSADAPYGKSLSTATETNLVALWHMDSNTLDSAGSFDGTLAGGARFSSAGRFGACLSLSGTGQWVGNITDAAEIRSTNLTVEAWIMPTAVGSRVIFDKSNGAQGYQLGTDASGRPYFRVGAATCTDPSPPLRLGRWAHFAATYSGSELRLYVNGEIRGRLAGAGAMGTADARIGADGSGGSCFSGLIDEVAVHDRVLGPIEIFDHYRAGAVTLKFQARSGSNSTLIASAPFTGPDRTTNTYFTMASGEDLRSCIPMGQFFQHRAFLATENHRLTPRLQGVQVDASSYSTDNPAVENAVSISFPGTLTMFSHKMATNDDSSVRYQVSGDNGATWYFWPAFTNAWTDAALYGGGWANASPVGTINANIGSFYRQLYEKTGVTGKWRALLHSTGSDQVALDTVSIGYSKGRIVLTAPNGIETNKDAWLIGTTNTIRWAHAGVVPGTASIQYSNENVIGWQYVDMGGGSLATGVVATADSCPWVTPSAEANHCLVRILSNSDPTIWDISDGEFQLVQRYRVVQPNGGERWYIGETNTVVWGAAQGLASVNLDFSGDDTWTNPENIARSVTSKGGSMSNTYSWVAAYTNPALPSETARIRVQTPGGGFTDYSDNFFVHAGVAITAPTLLTKVKKDDPYILTWKSAGCGGSVAIELQSVVGGPWAAIDTNAANTTGWNTYSWLVTNSPTEAAKLRIVSTSDSRARGESAPFIIAAVDIISPNGAANPANAEKWLMNTTQTVAWLSAGASANVNLHYSLDGSSNWTLMATKYPNNNTAGVTNYFSWVMPSTPSARSRVRVQDFDAPADLWSMSRYNFHIAGLKVVYPNGPISQEWLRSVPGVVTWEDDAVGNGCTVEISYTGGTNWETVSGPGQSLIDKAAPPFVPTMPTVRGLVRITADDATPFTNVFDNSDAYFAVAGVLVQAPTSGVSYTMGTTNAIAFTAAATHAPGFLANIYYAWDGVNFDMGWPVKSPEVFSETYPGQHLYDWVVEPLRKPSSTARVMVAAGTYTNISPKFTLRGMRFTQPTIGSIWSRGDVKSILWDVAGIALSSEGDVYVSTEGRTPAAFTNKVNGPRVVISDAGTAWSIPVDLDPTTNAYARIIVTAAPDQTNDIGLEAYSQVFTVRGLRVTAPTNGTVSQIGGTCAIQWKAADAGASVNIYYSSDGGTNYEAIKLAEPSGDGLRSYLWNVEMSRTPSLNARIKIVSATGLQDVSQPFTMKGIKIIDPRNQFVFARSSLTNMIRWVAVGDAGPYALAWATNATDFTAIQTVAGVSEYNWDAIPAEAVSPSVMIKIVGAEFSSTSDVFTIVAHPAVFIISPLAGDFWGIGLSHTIRWRRAGDMTTDFTVLFSLKPYTSTNDITDAPNITYDDSDKTYSMPWTVPDQPTQARIIVKHNTDATIADTSGQFNLCGRFTVMYPNGGENLFALQPTPVVWQTIGSVPFVDIYYSDTPPYYAASWTKVNTAPVVNKFNNAMQPEQTTWSWDVVNARTPFARFRVQEAQYTSTFDATELLPAGQEEPADESDAAFTIWYYTIYWDVIDQVTTQRLDNLSVIDSSGWSASDLSCLSTNTISHDYPWGTWNTTWYREFYFDRNVIDWKSENVALGGPRIWTQQVMLARSLIEPEYHTLASFSYNTSNKVFTIHAWIEHGGSILTTPSRCKITVYDAAGSQVAVIDSATVSGSLLGTGVFWLTWDASALPQSSVFFAKVDIEFSGAWYSSGLTFNLLVPLSDSISGMVAGISNQVAGVSNQVIGVSNQVTGVYTTLVSHEAAQALFRSRTDSNLTAIAETLGVLPGLTNLNTAVSNLQVAMEGVAKITNLADIALSMAGIQSNLQSIAAVTESSAPRITSRETTIKTGDTSLFVYRTKIGLGSGPVITVQDSTSATMYQANMSEIPNTGLYKGEVTFLPAWGLGEFSVSCRDSAAVGALGDQVVVQVVSEDYWSDKTTLESITGRLSSVETTVSNVWRIVSAADFGVSFSNMFASVSNLEAVVMSSGLTNAAALAGLKSDVSNVFASVSNLQQFVSSSSASNAAALTELGSSMSNVFESVSNLQQFVSSSSASNAAALAGLGSSVSNVFGSVSNLQELLSSASASNAASFAALSVDIGNVLGTVTNLSSLTNLISLQQLTSLTSLMALTNLTSLTNMDLAAIQTGVADVMGKVQNIDWSLVTQTSTDLGILKTASASSFQTLEAGMASLAGVASAIDELGVEAGAATTAATAASKDARSAKTQASAARSAVTALKTALGEGDKETAMAMLSNIKAMLTDVYGASRDAGGMRPVLNGLTSIADKINELARKKDLADLVTIPAELRAQGEITEKAMIKVNNKIAEINAAVEFLNKLVDKVANPPEVMTYYTTE